MTLARILTQEGGGTPMPCLAAAHHSIAPTEIHMHVTFHQVSLQGSYSGLQ